MFISEGLSDLYDVTEAVDGEDGLQKANELIPDLIISESLPRNNPNTGGITSLRAMGVEAYM